MYQNIVGDISCALRSVGRRPAFTIFVVLILSLGMGTNIAMFALLHANLIRPLPFPEARRLVMGRCTFGGRVNPWVSSADYYDYRDQSRLQPPSYFLSARGC